MSAIRRALSAVVAGAKALTRLVETAIAETEDRMLLRVHGRLIAFDRRARTVRVSAEPPIGFESLQRIEIVHRLNSDEAPEAWLIELQGKDIEPIIVGVERDPTEASILGARLSTIVGVKVNVARVPR